MKVDTRIFNVIALTASIVVFVYLASVEDQTTRNLIMKSWEENPFVSRDFSETEMEQPCTPLSNVVFIKTHKTGSTTIQSILYRYGLSRNLSLVFRRQNERNGHIPYGHITESSPRELFLPVLGKVDCSFKGYNISAIHVVHNRPVMETYMNPGSKYITILRNPASQLMSAFLFFHLDRKVKGNSSTEVKLINFMDGTTWKKSPYGRNGQSHYLGLDQSDFDDHFKINKMIQTLSKELDLVLISDYFEESLVLLKQELCWSFEDVVFTVQNNRSRPKPQLSPTLLTKMRSFNNADFLLYEHFNRTLWERIEKQGPKFWRDLREFKRVQNETMHKCFNSSTMPPKFNHSGDMNTFCEQYAGSFRLFKHLFNKQRREC